MNLLHHRKHYNYSIRDCKDWIRFNLSRPHHQYVRAHEFSHFSDSEYLMLKRVRKNLATRLHETIVNNRPGSALDIINNPPIINRKAVTVQDIDKFFFDNFRLDVYRCHDCEVIESFDNTYNVEDDYRVCGICVDHYYYHESEQYYSRHEDYSEDEDDYSVIKGYHSSKNVLRHIPSQFDTRKPRVLLGLELEVEVNTSCNRNDKAEEVKDLINHYQDANGKKYLYSCLEDDRSLNYGFEIVTAWTGLDVHEKMLKHFTENNVGGLKSHNTSTCGLHVHICKSDMTTLHASKMVLFINDENNRELIQAIARRNSYDYCKLKNKKDDKAWLKNSLSSNQKRNQLRHLNMDRYEALNFQNDNTIEFRLFKGSLIFTTIMACLEFTYATWFFCKDTSVNQLDTSHFLDFICKPENLRDTKHLREFLAKKNFSLPYQPKLKKVA